MLSRRHPFTDQDQLASASARRPETDQLWAARPGLPPMPPTLRVFSDDDPQFHQLAEPTPEIEGCAQDSNSWARQKRYLGPAHPAQPVPAGAVGSETPVLNPPVVFGTAAPAYIPDAHLYERRLVPEAERATYGQQATLRRFWMDCDPVTGRFEPMGRKTRAKGTVDKERQALNRFENYSRPVDHPAGQPWGGPSLLWLAEHPKYLDAVFARMGLQLSTATVAATKSHLMVILNHAVAMRAIPAKPKPEPIYREDGDVRILSPAELDALFNVLKPHPQLLAATITALHCGPRAEDLFLLRWDSFLPDAQGRRIAKFTAQKTGKLQGIPILEPTWWFLDKLPRTSACVFDGLCSPDAKEPEKSRPARKRNVLMKFLCETAGIKNLPKPWQSLRRTCNERLETVAPGVGQFVLGHSLKGVNAENYRQPTEAVWAGMAKVPLDKFVQELVPHTRTQLMLF